MLNLLQCIFLQIFGSDPHFSQRMRIVHTENRLNTIFGKNFDFIKKNSKIFAL